MQNDTFPVYRVITYVLLILITPLALIPCWVLKLADKIDEDAAEDYLDHAIVRRLMGDA